MTERWRAIPDTGGLFEVSNLGWVRSWAEPDGPHILTPYFGSHGYMLVAFSSYGHLVHQLVAEAFIGPRPRGLQVRHLDCDPYNNEATNLAYGTQAENNLDTVRNGRHPMANRTHCKNGHEFTPENTRRWAHRPNSRVCNECATERRSRSRNKRMEKANV